MFGVVSVSRWPVVTLPSWRFRLITREGRQYLCQMKSRIETVTAEQEPEWEDIHVWDVTEARHVPFKLTLKRDLNEVVEPLAELPVIGTAGRAVSESVPACQEVAEFAPVALHWLRLMELFAKVKLRAPSLVPLRGPDRGGRES